MTEPEALASLYGRLRIIGAEGRRVWAMCACGVVRQYSADAVKSGSITSCGCMTTPREQAAPSRRPASIASEIAALEARDAWTRHKGGRS